MSQERGPADRKELIRRIQELNRGCRAEGAEAILRIAEDGRCVELFHDDGTVLATYTVEEIVSGVRRRPAGP
jgi:hypothetical protein